MDFKALLAEHLYVTLVATAFITVVALLAYNEFRTRRHMFMLRLLTLCGLTLAGLGLYFGTNQGDMIVTLLGAGYCVVSGLLYLFASRRYRLADDQVKNAGKSVEEITQRLKQAEEHSVVVQVPKPISPGPKST